MTGSAVGSRGESPALCARGLPPALEPAREDVAPWPLPGPKKHSFGGELLTLPPPPPPEEEEEGEEEEVEEGGMSGAAGRVSSRRLLPTWPGNWRANSAIISGVALDRKKASCACALCRRPLSALPRLRDGIFRADAAGRISGR